MEVLKKGSIEALLIPIRDRLNNVSNLATVSNLLFDTKKKTDNSAVQTNALVTLDSDYPMTAICEIDTTLGGYTVIEDDNEFKLYIKYTTGTEAPILGPIYFRVEDD